jgi:hypothetical protein
VGEFLRQAEALADAANAALKEEQVLIVEPPDVYHSSATSRYKSKGLDQVI